MPNLDVPFCPQGRREHNCIPACIFMCLKYFGNIYGRSFIRDRTQPLSELAEIYELVEYDDSTDVTNEWADRVNERLTGLKLILRTDCTVDELITKFESGLPSIALYDQVFLMTGSQSNNHHAGVVIGINRRNVTVLDPSNNRHVVKVIRRFKSSLRNDPYNAILMDICEETSDDR